MRSNVIRRTLRGNPRYSTTGCTISKFTNQGPLGEASSGPPPGRRVPFPSLAAVWLLSHAEATTHGLLQFWPDFLARLALEIHVDASRRCRSARATVFAKMAVIRERYL